MKWLDLAVHSRQKNYVSVTSNSKHCTCFCCPLVTFSQSPSQQLRPRESTPLLCHNHSVANEVISCCMVLWKGHSKLHLPRLVSESAALHISCPLVAATHPPELYLTWAPVKYYSHTDSDLHREVPLL